jgi:long-chain fatty acid transport protein
MYLHVDFSADGNTSPAARTLPGGGAADSGDSNGWMPAGGMFYVHPLNDRLALGLAITGYFGLALDYQDNWVGRYYVQEVTLQAAGIQPAIAWKINDQVSVGAGAAFLYGILKEKMAINNIEAGAADGKLKLEDEDWTVQYNLGILLEPTKGTRIGLTYLSEAELNFEDRPEFSGLGGILGGIIGSGGRKIDLGMKMPQAVMLSVYHDVNNQLALMANVGWQDWSRFGNVEVSVSDSGIDRNVNAGFKDTWHGALGAQYRVSGTPWLLTAGVAYDSDMLHDDQLSPLLPVGETWRFGLGSRYHWSKDVTLGAAYELAWGGDLDLDVERSARAGRVSGTYESSALHVVSLNGEWRF